MRLTRVYVAEALAGRDELALSRDTAAHLTRVLRLDVGDELRAFDGLGGEYTATIAAVDRQGARIRLGQHHAVERESPLRVTLLQGIARGEKMDTIVQKATELGVSRIVPFTALRSSVRLDADTLPRKRAHWLAVAISACEQCGRNRLPEIAAPVSLVEAVAGGTASLRLLLAAAGGESLTRLLQAAPDPAQHGVRLLIGPEGGLDESEEQAALAAGYSACLLGPRVLRTETAPLAALAALQTLAGDFTNV
ncbi:MAG TPA: 16S rRNA (uracil(1498)-N(3))-methyltransferase [Steroidobacteraceae bacterium]|jgi:16S rRNA (uracil1498-N3)-methyltransferase|nr:16S rRNA (uracil(1498)-N(3))-methyltransferase [Steroidobacteraceae bacterium]